MKYFFRVTAIGLAFALILLTCTACTAKADVLALNMSNVPDYFEAVYYTKIMSDNKIAEEYDNNYLIEKSEVDGKKCVVLTTSADAPTKDNSGTQKLNTTSVLLAEDGDNYSVLMPLEITQTYEVTNKPTSNTSIHAIHDQVNKLSTLDITQYKKEDDAQPTEKVYKVKLATQYYDEDSLLLSIAAMPLQQGYTTNILLSASNRDRLQSMKVEVLADQNITVPAGSFDCYSVCIRPNTIFTNYATYMYFSKDNNNMLVKIQQSNTSLELKEFKFTK